MRMRMKLVSSKSIRASAVKSFNVVHARDAPSLTILPCKAGVGDCDDDDGDGDDDGDDDAQCVNGWSKWIVLENKTLHFKMV